MLNKKFIGKKSLILFVMISLILTVFLLLGVPKIFLFNKSIFGFSSNEDDFLPEIIISEQEIESVLTVAGLIEADGSNTIIAPFDGIIVEKNFSFDSYVEKGQTLVVLNTKEIDMQIAEAKIATLKSSQLKTELESWEKSSEVARASRAVLSAKLVLQATQHKATESELLFNRGIIPRLEYESLLEQISNQEIQLASANDELKTILEKSNVKNKQIAEIESNNANNKYLDLIRQLKNHVIEAPVSGVIAQVLSANTGQSSAAIQLGAHVTKGQPLFNILPIASLVVSAKVDEADVIQLSPNQEVNIYIDSQDGIPIPGQISRISAQALPNQGGPKTAQFELKIRIPRFNDDELKKIRVGMTCSLSIIKYRNRHAIVVPLNFIQTNNGRPYVWIKSIKGLQKQAVKLGHTTETGVEIVKGVKVGDKIVLPSRP